MASLIPSGPRGQVSVILGNDMKPSSDASPASLTKRTRVLMGVGSTALFFCLAEAGARLSCSGTLAARERILNQEEDLLSRDEEDGSWVEAPKAQDWAPTMRGNPFLLWEYAPGQRTESDTDVNINRLGLRGPEPKIPKPPGVRRLLSTGDSTIYGFKVRDGGVFIEVAADLLGEDVEAWNAAIPGYSSYQSLNMLEMRALELEPDVLVIGNIWSDNNFDTFVDKELLEVYADFESGKVNQLRGILGKSALFQALDYRLRLSKDSLLSARDQRTIARKVGWTVGGQDQNSGKRRVEANDYAANLHRLVDTAEGSGADAIFVLLPHPFDLTDEGNDSPAWSLYREIMNDVAKNRGAPLVNMVEVFQQSGYDRTELFFDEGRAGIQDDLHPSDLGHRIMGEALAKALSDWAGGEALMVDGVGGETGPYTDPYVFDEGDPTKVVEDGDPTATTITGRVDIPGFAGKRIQIDAILPRSRPPKVIGSTRISGPGPFEIQVPPTFSETTFIVYEDMTGNGPTSDDQQSFFGNNRWPIHDDDEAIELLIQH